MRGETARAKIESGAAIGWKDAERQIADETGRDVEAIRQARIREQRERGVSVSPLCETDIQADEKPAPICALWTGDQESYTPAKYIEAARAVMGSLESFSPCPIFLVRRKFFLTLYDVV